MRTPKAQVSPAGVPSHAFSIRVTQVCFKDSKFSFKVNSKNLAKFRINLAVGNLYF